MKNEKIWSFFMYLSNHMWDDENTPPRGLYESPRYEECNNVDIVTWDTTMKFLAERQYNMVIIDIGDGIKYESRPEISAPDAWNTDFLKKKLDEMRSLGLEPIPKLNFSCMHHTWLKKYRYMVSSPEYYAACADVIREVCEVFDHPRFIHLGLDEERASITNFREFIHVRNTTLWWHDAYFLFKEAEKNGARPWVWADTFWYSPDTFAEKMPHDVLLSNYLYSRMKEKYSSSDSILGTMMSAYEKLDKLGFEQIPCGSCCNGQGSVNLFQTLMHSKIVLTDNLVKGFLVVPWARTEAAAEFRIKDNAHTLYHARRLVYPETLIR